MQTLLPPVNKSAHLDEPSINCAHSNLQLNSHLQFESKFQTKVQSLNIHQISIIIVV